MKSASMHVHYLTNYPTVSLFITPVFLAMPMLPQHLQDLTMWTMEHTLGDMEHLDGTLTTLYC